MVHCVFITYIQLLAFFFDNSHINISDVTFVPWHDLSKSGGSHLCDTSWYKRVMWHHLGDLRKTEGATETHQGTKRTSKIIMCFCYKGKNKWLNAWAIDFSETPASNIFPSCGKIFRQTRARAKHSRWYWWENMYAGVEEGGGAAAEPEGGIP